MERSEHAALKIEATAPQATCVGATSRAANGWWLFCVLIFAIKLLLLWLDPTPKLYMGDSGSYIRTALSGGIPADRSYFYGYLVRWLAVWPHSLTPLLVIPGARQWRNSDCVCVNLQPLLGNVEQAFALFRIVVRVGSLSAGMGALHNDGDP
jgi:hypothetical protein